MSFILVSILKLQHGLLPPKCYKPRNIPQFLILLMFSPWIRSWIYQGAWGCVNNIMLMLLIFIHPLKFHICITKIFGFKNDFILEILIFIICYDYWWWSNIMTFNIIKINSNGILINFWAKIKINIYFNGYINWCIVISR